MRRLRRLGPRGVVATASLAVLVAGAAGLSWATSSRGAAETIHACQQKANGQVRIVSGARDCRPSEVHLSWNRKGVEGAAGL